MILKRRANRGEICTECRRNAMGRRTGRGPRWGGHNFIDMTGQRVGRLLVLNQYSRHENGYGYWLCRCACGTEKEIRVQSLRRADRPTLSCGCLRVETATATIMSWNASDARKFLQQLWNKIKAERQVSTNDKRE